MKNQLKIFENQEFGKIRVEFVEGEPWFVAKDVAIALGFKDPKSAIRDKLDSDEGVKRPLIDSMGRTQEAIYIRESGVYHLIFSSRIPTAMQFRRWVTDEVIPSIRKTGSYESIPSYQIDNRLKRAEVWITEEKERIRLSNENSELKEVIDTKDKQIGTLIKVVDKLEVENHAVKYGFKTEDIKASNKSDDILMVDPFEHPDYCTTSYILSMKGGYELTPFVLKPIASYLNYRVYRIPNDHPRDKSKLIYPRIIFDLAVKYQDRYWDEISQGTDDYQITAGNLANFIIQKLVKNGEKDLYYNKSNKDNLI